MAWIGLHYPETQARVVTGYSHLRWQDNHDDGQFNFLFNIINRLYFEDNESSQQIKTTPQNIADLNHSDTLSGY